MLTKTIGQLSAATTIADADLIEIEQSGVSKYGTVTMLETNLITNNIATTAQSLLASSNAVLMTPLQVREAFSANDTAPVYACRAWVTFDGSTVSSSISGTYTRVVGTTQTVCVATSHGMISGNVQYIDFVTGGASDNTYIVTVTDADTFTVNTISTSSILSSTLSLKRCPILRAANISMVSRSTTGTYQINFLTSMGSPYYSFSINCANLVGGTGMLANLVDSTIPTEYSFNILTQSAGAGTDADDQYITGQVFI